MKLLEWIKNEDDSVELLPLCHTTRWKNFEKILQDDKLSTKFSIFPDPVRSDWHKEVIYFFYGLPFYIYETGDGEEINIEITDDIPIGLLFKSDILKLTARMYPFDTGLVLSDLTSGIFVINSENEMKAYEVTIQDGTEIKRFIKRYYENNINYCYGEIKNIKPCCPKEENLLRLFNLNINSRIDLRHRAVEIHSLNDIFLSKYLFAVIFPRIRSRKYDYLIADIRRKYKSTRIEFYNDYLRFSSQSVRTALLNATLNLYDQDKSINFILPKV